MFSLNAAKKNETHLMSQHISASIVAFVTKNYVTQIQPLPDRNVATDHSTWCQMSGILEFHHSPHEYSTEYTHKSPFSFYLRPLL
jgi:hypothetical protein